MDIALVGLILLCGCGSFFITSYRFYRLRKKMNELAREKSDFKFYILRGMDKRFPFSEKTLSRMFDKYYIYITDWYALTTKGGYLVTAYRKAETEEFVFETFYNFVDLYIEGKINFYSHKEIFKYEGKEIETKEYGDIEYNIYSLTARGKEIYGLFFALAKLANRNGTDCSFIEEILLSGKKKEYSFHANMYY